MLIHAIIVQEIAKPLRALACVARKCECCKYEHVVHVPASTTYTRHRTISFQRTRRGNIWWLKSLCPKCESSQHQHRSAGSSELCTRHSHSHFLLAFFEPVMFWLFVGAKSFATSSIPTPINETRGEMAKERICSGMWAHSTRRQPKKNYMF